MQYFGIIPSRYNSSRFPGKPLALINGKSLIQRVYEQAVKADTLSGVYVATDDSRIEKHVKDFGGNVIMTSSDHQSGTDRCFEAASVLENHWNIDKGDVIINIQGDEPYINPLQINQLAGCFSNPQVTIATLVKKINTDEELFNPNIVKCVISANNNAIYFSRQAIPFIRNENTTNWLKACTFYKHIGIYAYKFFQLAKIINIRPSALELAESLEQLRWIENGLSVYTDYTEFETTAVDTPEDINKF